MNGVIFIVISPFMNGQLDRAALIEENGLLHFSQFPSLDSPNRNVQHVEDDNGRRLPRRRRYHVRCEHWRQRHAY